MLLCVVVMVDGKSVDWLYVLDYKASTYTKIAMVSPHFYCTGWFYG